MSQPCATDANKPHASTLMADILLTIVLNIFLFPGLAWVFYHSKEVIEGAVVGTEVFFGGVICTLVVGTTGHFMATAGRSCKACIHRNNCPFLAIFLVGLVMGIVCVTGSHLYFGNADVAFKSFLVLKVVQGLFLGVAIPLCMDKMKLII